MAISNAYIAHTRGAPARSRAHDRARPVIAVAIVATLATVLASAAPSPLAAQVSERPSSPDAPPVDACAGPASHAFDFWPGEWQVESRRLTPDGEWLETTQTWHAETVLGGCAFVDYTEGDPGGEPMKGLGSRFWDPNREEWVVTWLSTEAPGRLGIWRGTFDEDGRGEFFQETETPNGTVLSRISWYDITEDSAGWDHAISRDGGETWQITWTMRLWKVASEMR